MQNASRDIKSFRLHQVAGWIGVGMGVVHVVVAPMDVSEVLKKAVDDGVWNTFTLDAPTTLSEFERTAALWTTFGSFGVPVLAFGSYVVWSARRHQRVPGWLGWTFLAWGVPFTALVPASPAWAFPVMGALIVAGDRRGRLSEKRPEVSVATTPA